MGERIGARRVAIVGAGPAGLMVAEVLARAMQHEPLAVDVYLSLIHI